MDVDGNPSATIMKIKRTTNQGTAASKHPTWNESFSSVRTMQMLARSGEMHARLMKMGQDRCPIILKPYHTIHVHVQHTVSTEDYNTAYTVQMYLPEHHWTSRPYSHCHPWDCEKQ